MSSTESSGASAEATATSQPAGDSAPVFSFGSTRGSGLARGKRPSVSPASAAAVSPSGYKPTAIEILNAPREYQNPFAPVNPEPVAPAPTAPSASVETPAAVPAPSVASANPVTVAPVAPAPREPAAARVYVKPAGDMFPLDGAPASAPAESEEPAELNILPPERTKVTPAQTWESEGFKTTRATREERAAREERPRQEERAERSAPVDIASIPAKFLYVRPGYNYVPTPSNYGGAPRENRPSAGSSSAQPTAARPAAAAPEAKASGGIFGWIKSLFGDSSAPAPAASSPAAQPAGDRSYNRNRGQGGQGQPYGGGQRRSRGGRGRNRSGGDRGTGPGGDRGAGPGGDRGGSSAT